MLTVDETTGSTFPTANGSGTPGVQPQIPEFPDAGMPNPATGSEAGGAPSTTAAVAPGELNILLEKLLISMNIREEKQLEREEEADRRRTPIEQGK